MAPALQFSADVIDAKLVVPGSPAQSPQGFAFEVAIKSPSSVKGKTKVRARLESYQSSTSSGGASSEEGLSTSSPRSSVTLSFEVWGAFTGEFLCTVKASSSSLVRDLKRAIREEEGSALSCQRLFLNGRPLKDSQLVADVLPQGPAESQKEHSQDITLLRKGVSGGSFRPSEGRSLPLGGGFVLRPAELAERARRQNRVKQQRAQQVFLERSQKQEAKRFLLEEDQLAKQRRREARTAACVARVSQVRRVGACSLLTGAPTSDFLASASEEKPAFPKSSATPAASSDKGLCLARARCMAGAHLPEAFAMATDHIDCDAIQSGLEENHTHLFTSALAGEADTHKQRPGLQCAAITFKVALGLAPDSIDISCADPWCNAGGCRLVSLPAIDNSLSTTLSVTIGFLPSIPAGGSSATGRSDAMQVVWVSVFLVPRLPQELAWSLRATLYTQLCLPFNMLANCLLCTIWHGSPAPVFQDYAGGFACLSGKALHGDASVQCEGALRTALLFGFPGTLYTVSEFQLLQVASASAYFLLAGLQLPIQDAVLSASAVVGQARAAPFRAAFGPAIAVVAAGLGAYGLGAGASEADRPLGSIDTMPRSTHSEDEVEAVAIPGVAGPPDFLRTRHADTTAAPNSAPAAEPRDVRHQASSLPVSALDLASEPASETDSGTAAVANTLVKGAVEQSETWVLAQDCEAANRIRKIANLKYPGKPASGNIKDEGRAASCYTTKQIRSMRTEAYSKAQQRFTSMRGRISREHVEVLPDDLGSGSVLLKSPRSARRRPGSGTSSPESRSPSGSQPRSRLPHGTCKAPPESNDPEEHRLWAEKLWSRFDRDSSGFVTREELNCDEFQDILRTVLAPQRSGVTLSVFYARAEINVKQSVELCLRKADYNNNGILSYGEFAAFLRELRNHTGYTDLIFSLFDLDCNGVINKDEFREVYRYFLGHTPIFVEFEAEWAKLDEDGAGQVTKAQYKEWMTESTNPIFHQFRPQVAVREGEEEKRSISPSKMSKKDGRSLLAAARLAGIQRRNSKPMWNEYFVGRDISATNAALPARMKFYFSQPQSLPEFVRYYSRRPKLETLRDRLEKPEPPRFRSMLTGDMPSFLPERNLKGGRMRDEAGRPVTWDDSWQIPAG
ncbi:unnamed protein product, partial [Polarella glacialis]